MSEPEVVFEQMKTIVSHKDLRRPIGAPDAGPEARPILPPLAGGMQRAFAVDVTGEDLDLSPSSAWSTRDHPQRLASMDAGLVWLVWCPVPRLLLSLYSSWRESRAVPSESCSAFRQSKSAVITDAIGEIAVSAHNGVIVMSDGSAYPDGQHSEE